MGKWVKPLSIPPRGKVACVLALSEKAPTSRQDASFPKDKVLFIEDLVDGILAFEFRHNGFHFSNYFHVSPAL